MGAGQKLDQDGLPQGPWTPELLAQAISQIGANREGIELRTVQLWFQENDKGISARNIRWLARIFGCGDPDASLAWQAELSAANRRLIDKRRKKKTSSGAQPGWNEEQDQRAENVAVIATPVAPTQTGRQLNLAIQTEAIFGNQSSMALPLVVFTGACALGWCRKVGGNLKLA